MKKIEFITLGLTVLTTLLWMLHGLSILRVPLGIFSNQALANILVPASLILPVVSLLTSAFTYYKMNVKTNPVKIALGINIALVLIFILVVFTVRY